MSESLKTVWKKLDVSMPKERKDAILSACQLLGLKPCQWARNELEIPYLRLCAAAEQKRKELQALITPEKSGGGHAARPSAKTQAWRRNKSGSASAASGKRRQSR